MAWRFFATRLDGRGGESLLAADLPVSDGQVTSRLTGISSLSGKITPEVTRLKAADGALLLEPWSTCVWAEDESEQIVGGGILAEPVADGESLELDCVGFAAAPGGTPYRGEQSWSQVEPLDVAEHIWAHVQGELGGNLGLRVVSATRSGALLGKLAVPAAGDVAAVPAEPYILADWQTDDLAQVLADLARDTPFEWVETHSWNADKSALVHTLTLTHPRIGRRRTDRYVIGENVTNLPKVTWTDYATDVLVLGAGEGRKKIRKWAMRHDHRPRRVAVVQRSDITTSAAAYQEAQRLADSMTGHPQISELRVRGQVPALGDEIRVLGPAVGWAGSLDLWVRVHEVTRTADSPDVTLTVRRAA